MAGQDQEAALAELRREIDRIDGEMHGLLMARGRIIDRLIAVKGGTAATGSAFRPEREASMMRAMAERHDGGLPFDAVEGIWRIIISTFTHLQAPFGVHADMSGDATAMRDSARYHFGFTVPVTAETGAAAVVAAVAASRGDLGLIAVADAPGPAASDWWRLLEPEDAPKVIAHLPFVARAGHPAPHPVLVLATSVSGEGLGATVLYSVGGFGSDDAALRALGGRVVAERGREALIAVPRDVDAATLARDLRVSAPIVVGSHPAIATA